MAEVEAADALDALDEAELDADEAELDAAEAEVAAADALEAAAEADVAAAAASTIKDHLAESVFELIG